MAWAEPVPAEPYAKAERLRLRFARVAAADMAVGKRCDGRCTSALLMASDAQMLTIRSFRLEKQARVDEIAKMYLERGESDINRDLRGLRYGLGVGR